jgi:hypothetical protein
LPIAETNQRCGLGCLGVKLMKLREGCRREPLVDWELGSPFGSART